MKKLKQIIWSTLVKILQQGIPLISGVVQGSPRVRALVLDALKGTALVKAPVLAGLFEAENGQLYKEFVPFKSSTSTFEQTPAITSDFRKAVIICENGDLAKTQKFLTQSRLDQVFSAQVLDVNIEQIKSNLSDFDLVVFQRKGKSPNRKELIRLVSAIISNRTSALIWTWFSRDENLSTLATTGVNKVNPMEQNTGLSLHELSEPQLVGDKDVKVIAGDAFVIRTTTLLQFLESYEFVGDNESLTSHLNLHLLGSGKEFRFLATPQKASMSQVERMVADLKHAVDNLKVSAHEKTALFIEAKRGVTLALEVGESDIHKTDWFNTRVLAIQPIEGGGLKKAALELSSLFTGHNVDYLFASSEGRQFTIRDSSESIDRVVIQLDTEMHFPQHVDNQHDWALLLAVASLGIDFLVIEHMARQSFGLVELARKFGIGYVVNVHDYYLACTSHTLLTAEGNFCKGVCDAGTGGCSTTNWSDSEVAHLKNDQVYAYRQKSKTLLENASAVVAPSKTAAKILFEAMGLETVPKLEILEHQLPDTAPQPPRGISNKRLLILGDIGIHKGALILNRLVPKLESDGFEIHFVGKTWPGLRGKGVHHGEYRPENLPEIIAQIGPELALIPSIFPETYCYVLSECLWNGVPVLASRLGALEERIANNPFGFLVTDYRDSESWLFEIRRIFLGSTLDEARSSLKLWQQNMRKSDDSKRFSDAWLSIIKHMSV
jgi:hypothetical protein